MSTTRVSRAQWAGGPRARSPIRKSSDRRSRKPWRSSRRASPRLSIQLLKGVEVKHMRLVLRSIGLAAVAAGVVLGSGVALAQGDAAKGKEAYMKYGCWQCHG